MIYKLRRKFIKICFMCFLAVFAVLAVSISAITTIQTNRSLDNLADVLSSNDGAFPQWTPFDGTPERLPIPDGMNVETPFTTRFFTVRFDKNGELLRTDVASIASVSVTQAVEYAEMAIAQNKERGWIEDFRYKMYDTDQGQAVIFVNGLDAKENARRFLPVACLVFAGGSMVMLVLVVLISRPAVQPAAESYEKQKQFITDANHELKTPLTLIHTNLDIMEAELGANEWLDDIREESKIMTEMVNQLVVLARMDEDSATLEKEPFSLSNAVLDTVSSFSSAIQKDNKKLLLGISEGVVLNGNEGAIRQLVSILMDNAVKYCDPWGTIGVALYGGKHPVLTIDNSYAAVDTVPLDKLFDRFYRADKARTYGNGFGLGLSIAKSITEKHHGQIKALNPGNSIIRFQVHL